MGFRAPSDPLAVAVKSRVVVSALVLILYP